MAKETHDRHTQDTKRVHAVIPRWFYDGLQELVDGIEVQSFSHLVALALSQYQRGVEEGVKPPPRVRAYNTLVKYGDVESAEKTTKEKNSNLGEGEGSPRGEGEPAKPVVRRRVIRYPDLFEKFWRAYPNSRGSKEKTLDEWNLVVDGGVASDEVVISGVEGYARRCKRDRTDPRYVKQPLYWLKDRRWEDEDKSGAYSALPELKENQSTEKVVWVDGKI